MNSTEMIEQRLSRLGYQLSELNALNELIKAPSGLIVLIGSNQADKARELEKIVTLYNKTHQGQRILQFVTEDDQKSAISTLMRNNPDALLIHEIKDHQTVKLAQEAIKSGHLVITTIPSDMSHSLVNRLIELDLDFSSQRSKQNGLSQGYIIPVQHLSML